MDSNAGSKARRFESTPTGVSLSGNGLKKKYRHWGEPRSMFGKATRGKK